MGTPAYFGRYRVLRVRASGEMGTVYVAEDPDIGREVAIKSLRFDPSCSEEDLRRSRERFEREIRIAGTFSHPNIVTVFDVGRQDGRPFVAMELVDGPSLREEIRTGHRGQDGRRGISAERVAELLPPICSALDYAAERGVIHRDVKPGNVLLTADGRPKLSDFGVARLSDSTMTVGGRVFGSPAYMSPEQVKGEELTGRADQFAAGILAYEMLTGRRPFPGETIHEVMYAVVHEAPRDPRSWNPGIPLPAARALLRALEKAPGRRYMSCTEFASVLVDGLSLSFERRRRDASSAETGVDTMALRSVELITAGVSSLREGLARLPARISGEAPVVRTAGVLARSLADAARRRPALALALGVSLAVVVGGWAADLGDDTVSGQVGDRVAGAGAVSREAATESGPATATRSATLPSPGSVDNPDAASGDGPVGDARVSGNAAAGTASTAPGSSLELTVVSNPPGARVLVDGEPLGETTPARIRVRRGEERLLRVEREGYRPVVWRLDVDRLEDRHLASGELFFPLESLSIPATASTSGATEKEGPRPLLEDDLARRYGSIDRIRAPGGVTVPERLHYVEPEIPAEAGASGVVLVEIEINTWGAVVGAKLLRGLDDGVDRAILDAVLTWRYEPTEVDGEPVHVVTNVTVPVGRG